MIWWEKHIEYMFVRDSKSDFAMPLAGQAETALSDLIFGAGDKLVLIEFKRDLSAIRSEKDKFLVSLEDAAAAVKNHPKCHYLVYGEQSRSDLELKSCGYFNKEQILPQNVLDQGVSLEAFKSYCESLMPNRQPDKRCSGIFSFSGLEQVVGVSPDKCVKTVTLKNYLDNYHPALSPASKPAPKRPGPGRK